MTVNLSRIAVWVSLPLAAFSDRIGACALPVYDAKLQFVSHTYSSANVVHLADTRQNTLYLIHREKIPLIVKMARDTHHEKAIERFGREFARWESLKKAYPDTAANHYVPVLGFEPRFPENPALILPFVNGGALRRQLTYFGPENPASRILQAMHQIAVGVQMAHSLGFAHGDLGIDNVLVETIPGNPKIFSKFLLTDLSFAFDLDETTFSGTWRYMPPEVLWGNPVTAQKQDMHALMILFQELALGLDLKRVKGEMFDEQEINGKILRTLNRSVFSFRRKSSPLVSILAWTQFKNANQAVSTIEAAIKAEADTTVFDFFRTTYRGVVSQMTAKEKKRLGQASEISDFAPDLIGNR